jgi:AraC family transcriptional regulator of arabinose operon
MNPTLEGMYSWPSRGLSVPRVAGNFTIQDRGFLTIYRIPFLAVHLYSYAGVVRFGDAEAQLEPGDLTITPPGTGSSYHLPRPGSHWCLHVPVPEGAGGGGLGLPWHVRLGDAASMVRERLVRIIDHVGRARSSPGGPAEAAAAGGVLELFAWLAERPIAGAAGNRGERAIAQAAAELRLRPERSWRIADLAAKVGVSPGYLARCFRQRFGHTLARYQLIQRVGAAQALLACTADPIGEVGARVGLPDPHHFNKLFRRITGVPPSVFRSTHRTGDHAIGR